MLNPDGSDGGMCGNGVRCVGRYLADQGQLVDTTPLWVGERQLSLSREGDEFSVDMGLAEVQGTAIVEGYEGWQVWVGNPHFVAQVADLDAVDLSREGPIMEMAPQFPDRSNIHFFSVVKESHLRGKTWERGAGITLACGSGACAIAAAAMATGLSGRPCRVALPGGSLLIPLADAGHFWMTGAAAEAFVGSWED